MNKMLKGLAVVAAFGASSVCAKEIFFIKSDELLRTTKEGISILKQFEKEQDDARQVEAKKTEDLNSFRNKIGEGLQAGKYDEASLQVESEKFAKMQKDTKRSLEDLQEKLEAERQKVLGAFSRKIAAVAADICKNKGGAMAQDISKMQGVLYIDPSCDITSDVLKELNAGFTKLAAKSSIIAKDGKKAA